MIRQAVRGTTLALAFLLELCALAALGYWGVHSGSGPATKTVLGVGAPLLAAVLWGLFAAPKATFSVPAAKVAVEVPVFGAAALALYASGHHALAVAFAVLTAANSTLVRL